MIDVLKELLTMHWLWLPFWASPKNVELIRGCQM